MKYFFIPAVLLVSVFFYLASPVSFGAFETKSNNKDYYDRVAESLVSNGIGVVCGNILETQKSGLDEIHSAVEEVSTLTRRKLDVTTSNLIGSGNSTQICLTLKMR